MMSSEVAPTLTTCARAGTVRRNARTQADNGRARDGHTSGAVVVNAPASDTWSDPAHCTLRYNGKHPTFPHCPSCGAVNAQGLTCEACIAWAVRPSVHDDHDAVMALVEAIVRRAVADATAPYDTCTCPWTERCPIHCLVCGDACAHDWLASVREDHHDAAAFILELAA
jgi:hypothetical protein